MTYEKAMILYRNELMETMNLTMMEAEMYIMALPPSVRRAVKDQYEVQKFLSAPLPSAGQKGEE